MISHGDQVSGFPVSFFEFQRSGEGNCGGLMGLGIYDCSGVMHLSDIRSKV